MNKRMLLLVFVALLAIPMTSYAEASGNWEGMSLNDSSNKDDQSQAPSKAEDSTPSLYARAAVTESYAIDEKESRNPHGKALMFAQNANNVPCYKEVDMKDVLFRWCPAGKPWTPTNEKRSFCYSTSEACAEAEMPQSWCIKCENQ